MGHEQRFHMTVNSDRVMTRDEVAQHVARMFARLDTNHDGFITREEVDAMPRKLDGDGAMSMARELPGRLEDHGVMMGDRAAIFDRLDTNHDGSISRQEFMAATPRIREQRVMIMRDGPGSPAVPGQPDMRMPMHEMGAGRGMGGLSGRLFDMADANHDGRVSLAEAQAAALAHFDRADLNHDGKITPEERQQAHAMRRDRRAS
jgi:hypothetical protein